MEQCHQILLWKEHCNKIMEFEEIAEFAYSIFSVFQGFPDSWRPNYLAGYKKNTKRFDWSYDNFCEELKKHISKEGKISFPGLGYNMQFYSSLNNDESFGFYMSAGITNPKFINSFNVNISYGLDMSNIETADMVADLFAELVEKFSPFWGCVVNNMQEPTFYDRDKKLPLNLF